MEVQSWLRFQKPILLEGMASHFFPAEALASVIKENYPEIVRKNALMSIEAYRLAYMDAAEADATANLADFPIASTGKFMRWAMPEHYPLRAAVFVSRFQSDLAGRTGPLTGDETWASRGARPGSGRIFVYGQEMDPRPAFDRVLVGPVVSATLLHLTAALELHYLKHGRYPLTLAELETGLSPGALRDMDGEPFGYSIDAGGAHFILSSKGQYNTPDIWSTMPDAK